MGLFSGKKPALDQTARRTKRINDGGRPDYVYYANRRSDLPLAGKGAVTERSRSMLNAPVGTKRPVSKRSKMIFFWLVIVAVLVLVFQLSVVSGHSKVVILQLDGTQTVDGVSGYEKTVNQLLATSILNRSKITIDARGVADELRKRHPEVESAVLTLPFVGGQPTLYISQSEPVFVLQQGVHRYILSASGYITGNASSDSELPLVEDQTPEMLTIGKQLLPRSSVQFMRNVQYQLEQANIPVSSLVLPAQKAYEVDARLKDKPYIVRFNLEEDAIQQSGAAIATIQQLGQTVPASYLDVRVPERVYYK